MYCQISFVIHITAKKIRTRIYSFLQTKLIFSEGHSIKNDIRQRILRGNSQKRKPKWTTKTANIFNLSNK